MDPTMCIAHCSGWLEKQNKNTKKKISEKIFPLRLKRAYATWKSTTEFTSWDQAGREETWLAVLILVSHHHHPLSSSWVSWVSMTHLILTSYLSPIHPFLEVWAPTLNSNPCRAHTTIGLSLSQSPSPWPHCPLQHHLSPLQRPFYDK